jgi:hypothetical protein
VAITDYIEPRSLSLDYAGTRKDLVVELSQALRALHAIEGFPPLVDYLDGLSDLVDQAARSGVAAAEALTAPLTAWARLYEVCRRLEPQLVSSHNDLNPRNLLYDGRRVWLIDWEAAFRADRYVDLAAIANVYAADAEGEALLLRTYFGREATTAERARLYLFRQVSHVFHAAVFTVGVAGQARAERLDGPELDAIHQGLALGEPLLDTPEGRLTYGLARWRRAMAGIGSPAFVEAARIAAIDPAGHRPPAVAVVAVIAGSVRDLPPMSPRAALGQGPGAGADQQHVGRLGALGATAPPRHAARQQDARAVDVAPRLGGVLDARRDAEPVEAGARGQGLDRADVGLPSAAGAQAASTSSGRTSARRLTASASVPRGRRPGACRWSCGRGPTGWGWS